MQQGGAIRGWVREHATTLGFYLYALFAAPPLARALKAGLADPQPVVWPGLLLLGVLLLEPFGLRWKMLFLRRRNRDEGFEPQGEMLGLGSVTVIGHMIVAVLVGLVALDCLGLAGEGANPNWMAGMALGLVFMDLVAFFSSGGQDVSREPPGHWKEGLADVLLLAFGCVAYTVWWQGFFDLGDLAAQSLGMKIALAILLGGVFALFYLPMRVPFVLEECYLRPAQGRKARILGELAIGALLGFYPAFF
ncbi:MAG: hypothetical protein EOM72_06035 [Opitutae bacterium]|nr:hypothetical protein [Opitutae bacterium]